MKKIHYVPRKIWDAKLFAYPVCTPWITVETHKHPNYCRLGSTYRRDQVTCGNCKRTKEFRGVK